MSLLFRPIRALASLLARLGVCANAGLVVGMMTGGMIGILAFFEGPLNPFGFELMTIWAATASFGWIVLLFIFVPLSRWSFSSVALPSLVNSVMVSGLTILLCRALDWYIGGWLVGLLAGLAIGFLLCGLYRFAAPS